SKGELKKKNARTNLINKLKARYINSKFNIRKEDTDINRNGEGGEESQLTYLKWIGLDWDEGTDKGGNYGPYRQMERLDLYKKYVDELLERDLAYECFMTSEELEAEREAQIAAGKAPQYSGAHSNLTE